MIKKEKKRDKKENNAITAIGRTKYHCSVKRRQHWNAHTTDRSQKSKQKG